MKHEIAFTIWINDDMVKKKSYVSSSWYSDKYGFTKHIKIRREKNNIISPSFDTTLKAALKMGGYKKKNQTYTQLDNYGPFPA